MKSLLRIGTRGSPLALWQARQVASLLSPSPVELVEIRTTGDSSPQAALAAIGGQGVFTKEIQEALLDRRIDVAVHSLKDLPTHPVPGLVLAAVPPRGPVEDVLVGSVPFDQLPREARLATGSARRAAQILARRSDLRVEGIRGNIDTRLRKLKDQGFDGLVLARAGLERLGLAGVILESLAWMLPAIGQGALGIECREEDALTRQALERLDHAVSRQAVLAERSFLRSLGGGCQLPIAGHAAVMGGTLSLRGAVFEPRGRQQVQGEIAGPAELAEDLGRELAARLLVQGAEALFTHGNG